MVFSTTIFVFAYLPAFLAVYYLLPFRFRSTWILAASLVFYGWWRLDFLALIVATTVWTYLLGGVIARGGLLRAGANKYGAHQHDADQPGANQQGALQPGARQHGANRAPVPRTARNAMILGTVLNIGTLGYFKYFNFGVDSLNAIITALGGSGMTAWEVVLPVGISFYVFQATSYLIDLYRGDAEPAETYIDLAAYIALFPQLVAGPIVRYHDVASQFRSRRHTFALFSEGAYRFMVGFGKKVLIADTVARIADSAFALPAPHAADAWLGIVAYAMQIYFDFSGYSDMAIGLGLMIGFRFKENFDRPYLSRSITEFWRRWHISLSLWLRNYLYIPLGGNRVGTRRTYVNLMMVMVLGGLWHGAAWTFVLWGAWHGLWLILERLFSERGQPIRGQRTGGQHPAGQLTRGQLTRGQLTRGQLTREQLARGPLGLLYTGIIVSFGWVLFRAPSLAVAGDFFSGLFGFYGVGLSAGMAWDLSGLSLAALIAASIIVYVPTISPHVRRFGGVAVPAIFVVSIVKLTAEQFSPFLYFQF
jgi:alginate O-acetyltransferase complex protein AlgI